LVPCVDVALPPLAGSSRERGGAAGGVSFVGTAPETTAGPSTRLGGASPRNAGGGGQPHTTYDVTFPLFAKIEVNGEGTHPLYRWLKSQQTGIFRSESVKWNFTKFLVDQAGRVVARFAPRTTPEEIEGLLG
jgi:hypothetical protein